MIKFDLVMGDIEKITSRDNRRLVHARKVRDGKITEQIFIEGRRLVEEVLRSDLLIDDCFVSEGFADNKLVDTIGKRNVPIAKLSDRIFGSIADTKQPQGIILIAKRPTTSLAAIEKRLRKSALPIVIFLKETNNPSNLGAILRTAEAAGVPGGFISPNSADVFSPKALRASMGAAFRLPVMEDADLREILIWAKKENLILSATTTSAGSGYTDIDWKRARLLIFGSEAHGLSPSELEHIDEGIRIPMENNVESLNLAVSAGIILFDAKRQISNG